MQLEHAIDIDASSTTVWEKVSDIERWAEWLDSIDTLERLDSGDLAVGSKARIKQPRMPAMLWEVTDLQPGQRFDWETRSPGVHTVAVHRVEALEGGGSRLHLSIHQEGLLVPLFAALTRGMVERNLEIEAAGIKRVSEASRT